MSEAASSRDASLIRSTCLWHTARMHWCQSTFRLNTLQHMMCCLGVQHTPAELQEQKDSWRDSDRVRLDPFRSLWWDVPTAAGVRHTSKSWLAAVTRTVEWRIGAMCVSQWLTCFQKSQVRMALEAQSIPVNIWINITEFRWQFQHLYSMLSTGR